VSGGTYRNKFGEALNNAEQDSWNKSHLESS
jgi:hypothetical protein